MLKKPELEFYHGQMVQAMVNSFRNPVQVKDESSAMTKTFSTAVPNATKSQPMSTISVTMKNDRGSHTMTATRSVSPTFQNRLFCPPTRSHHNSIQDSMKQGSNRTSSNVTIQKGSREIEWLPLNAVLSSVKTSSSQEAKRNKILSGSITSDITARPAPSSDTKPIGKSKPTHQFRRTMAKATINNKSAQSKETTEERRVSGRPAKEESWEGVLAR